MPLPNFNAQADVDSRSVQNLDHAGQNRINIDKQNVKSDVKSQRAGSPQHNMINATQLAEEKSISRTIKIKPLTKRSS